MFLRSLAVVGAMGASLFLNSCSRGTIPVRTYPMGERVQIGTFIFTVFETQWLTQLGDPPSQRVPQQRYFLVRMSITNAGGSDAIVPALALVDESGAAHPELINGY